MENSNLMSQLHLQQEEVKELKAAVGVLNKEKVNMMREMTLLHEAKVRVDKDCAKYLTVVKEA